MNPRLKNILIFGSIFALLVVGYVVFFAGKSDTPALTTTGGTSGASTQTSIAGQSAVGKEFLATLLNLRNIKLDDSIFTDPTFASLQDFELTLIPEANPGRTNPFLPLGNDLSSPSSTTTIPSTGTTAAGSTTGTTGPSSPTAGGLPTSPTTPNTPVPPTTPAQ